jgi:5'-nucleotidase
MRHERVLSVRQPEVSPARCNLVDRGKPWRLRPPFSSLVSVSLAALTLASASHATPVGTVAPVSRVAPVAKASKPISLRLVAINDFHGNLEEGTLTLPWPDPANPSAATTLATGGAAALAGLVQSLRQGAPHSLVLSSGDLFGATPLISALLRHEPTIAFANALGLDLASPGNHEFDAGTAEYVRLLQGGCAPANPGAPQDSCVVAPSAPARFETLATNITTANGANLFPATSIQAFGGVKVGFIGAVTRSMPSLVLASAIKGLRFDDEVASINRAAAALQRQGVQAIVAVIHEGGETGTPGQPLDWNNPTCPNARGPIFTIARQLTPAIDVVFSAHTHQGYNCLVEGRPVLQATAFGRGVAVVDLVLDPRSGDVDRQRTSSRNLPVLNSRTDPLLRQAVLDAEPMPWRPLLERATPMAAVADQVATYARAVAPRAQRQVGHIGGSFDRNGATDSAAGRLIADAQLAATRAAANGGAQAALVNSGSIRTNLNCRGTPPCPVTYGDLFAMQPFGNAIVVLTLNGAELKQLLERQQPPDRSDALLLQPSASLRYSWASSAPFGQRVRNLTLDNRPLQPSQSVRLAVNAFLAQGGDGFDGFLQGRDPVGGPQDVEALEAYLQTTRSPDPCPRITLVEASAQSEACNQRLR